MGTNAFISTLDLPFTHRHHPTRRRPTRRRPSRRLCVCRDGGSVRIAISQSQASGKTVVRNAHIAVLTDFSSNPVLAIRDRAADPLSAVLIAFAAVFGGLLAKITGRKRHEDTFGASEFSSVSSSETDNGAETEVGNAGSPIPASSRATSGENAIWLNMRCVRTMLCFICNLF